MKTFISLLNILGSQRHGSFRSRGSGILSGVLCMLFATGATICLADSADVTENLSYYPPNTTMYAGQGFTVYADADQDGTWDTMVCLVTVHGNAGNYSSAYEHCGTWSYIFSPGSYPQPSGQYVIRFVDMLAPGFIAANQSTWVYKSVPGVRLWTDNEWVACGTNSTGSPYFQVSAYSELNQGGTVVYSQTYTYGSRTDEIRSASGLKEVFIHSDSCENTLDCLNVLSSPQPSNDLWSGATHLTGGVTSSMSTANATSTGDPISTCGYHVSNTVWFAFTPATSRVVAVNTCGSDFDTVLQAYVNIGGTLTPVAGGCDDDSNVCPGTRQSCLAFAATAGTTYYLMAGGYNGASGNLSITASDVPAAITQQPVGGTVNAGESIAFSVNATGPGLAYQWQLGGSSLSDATANGSTLTLTNLNPGNAGDYRVIVTNVYGAVTSAVATLAVQPALDLALDTTGLTWTTGGGYGGYGWFRQTDASHDGVDSAECESPELISPYSTAWMQTSVTGPGTLTFYWRFFVPLHYPRITDYLGFFIDGGYQAGVGSPFAVWSYQTIYVGAGSHTLKWSYVRSGSTHGGGPGYMDQVGFTAGTTAALISNQPDPQTALAGTTATFSVQAGGTPPLRYQWRCYGTNLVGATDSSLTLTNVMPVQAGNYSVVITNDYGPAVTSSLVALTVTTIPLAEALDYNNPGWNTYGNGYWFGQVGQTHDGVDAARSGAITNYQQSVISLNLVGPGTLSFWWKVSSETNYDHLYFFTNGAIKTAISGEVDWQQQTASLPAGMNTVLWIYYKDITISLGQDAAWLDQVSYDGPPYLAISPLTDQQIMLFWPTSATGFALQCATNLVHPASWQWVTNVPAVVDDNWVVTNNAASQQFYRLKR